MGEVEKGILKYIVQTSLQGCEHGCEKMPLCVTAKFHRFSSLCTLYSIERDQTPDPGFYFYTKPSFITPDETHNCGNAECSCGEPAPIKSTQILGNMVSVGSKIKYHCLDASNSQISKCLSNGTWSHVEISCNCSLPDNIHGVPLPWSYLLRDRNSLEAHVACSEVCTSSSGIAATCNPNTGVWSFSTGSCCFNFACSDAFGNTTSCYAILNRMVYHTGVNFCTSLGGHPVYIETGDENDWLKEFLRNSGSSGNFFYIGINDCLQNTHWVYEGTDMEVSFKGFYPQNEGFHSSECCAGMLQRYNFDWIDIRCSGSYNLICEFEIY